ncbi:MAG: hypothetical protein ACLRFI_04225 [Alphaproteobacteria bacterium]
MTRVLQLRRGTTADNNNFTGLAGEITFDTDAKTLRVHDGATLGGFALARTDNQFDINNVSDDFWESKIPQFVPAPFTILTSSEYTISDCVFIEALFNTNIMPYFCEAFLVCQSSDADYNIGDIVHCFSVQDGKSTNLYRFIDHNGLHLRIILGHKNICVPNKTTGFLTDIDNSCWKIKFRVCC